MKLLLAHNFYGSAVPSGENRVFEGERALLRDRGHDVRELVRYSDDLRKRGVLGTIQGALATPWNPFAAARARLTVQEFAPDVVHVHNVFPSLSPAILRSIPPHVARVLTLHNYRLYCAAGIPLRGEEPCTDCLRHRSVLPALIHGCYRGSRLATLPLAISIALHRLLRTWEQHVDIFIALTDFQRELMVSGGLPARKVRVKPNFYAKSPAPIPWDLRGEYAVFAGRLTWEKGVDTLIKAWLAWGSKAPELRILGSGPDRGALEALASTRGTAQITFLGQVSPDATEEAMAHAKLVIVPSRCFESFSMVIAEAFAHGTAVAASNIGSLPNLVQKGINGITFDPGDPTSLLAQVRLAWDSPSALERLSRGARTSYESNYTAEANYRMLLDIYDHAQGACRDRQHTVRS